jgi:hypothetical protein
MSTAKWQNIAGSKKFFSSAGINVWGGSFLPVNHHNHKN